MINANVFDISIDFFQTKVMKSRNRKIAAAPFQRDFLISKYDPAEVCYLHKNRYAEKENIIFAESSRIIIHHTKTVETLNKTVLYRPTISSGSCCDCKQFYTGKDDQLLRVSAAKMKITGKERTLHFVSYELYFTFLSQLVKGGQTMSAFIKSQKFMNELYFGSEKNPVQKGTAKRI